MATKKPASKPQSVHDMPELQEKTLVLVKPDGVMRGIVGKVITRFEETGLKLVGIKMLRISREFAMEHHPPELEKWLAGMGGKTLEGYKKYGRDPMKELGTDDPLKIGKLVWEWNTEFLTSAPIVAMVWQGNHSIDNVRKIVGSTLPVFALPGTIRGDFSKDSPALANAMKRGLHNVVHASGDPAEATYDIDHWFAPEEIQSYQRMDWEAMFGQLKA